MLCLCLCEFILMDIFSKLNFNEPFTRYCLACLTIPNYFGQSNRPQIGDLKKLASIYGSLQETDGRTFRC